MDTFPSSASLGSLAAGPFGNWLAEFRESLRGTGGTSVPCGDCVGCCVSSYHIPIRPDDRLALAKIPIQHLVTAPGQSRGHQMMRYLADGTCPMLSHHQCTIYAERPQTCRDYDCRVFAAAGIDAGGNQKHVINTRVRAWRFSYPTEIDKQQHSAVLAAAKFIADKATSFADFRVPTAPTGIAVLATKVYEVFLIPAGRAQNDAEIASAIVTASQTFDATGGA